MAKFRVLSYYQYVGIAEVEADSVEEAFEKGYAINYAKSTDDLQYVDYTDSEVITEDGGIYQF